MVLTDKLNRAAVLAIAGLLFLASLVPLLTRQKASAYTLLGPRKIKMSSASAGNAANGSGAGVTYEVEFELATTAALQGIVVTFCENSPIIEDTVCDLPAGFSLDAASVSASASAADIDPSGWASAVFSDQATGAPGINNTLVLSDGTGSAGATAGNVVRFDIDGVTNPNAVNSSFYARIYTYDTQADAQAYDFDNLATLAPATDAGGIALSTAEQITVTAKVQERITFCVYTDDFTITDFPDAPTAPADITNNCTAKAGSSITLGDHNGVLDSIGPYVDKTAYFGITTNAAGDAVIRLKGNTLSNGTETIDAIGAAAVSAPGAEQFGLCVYPIFGTGLTISDGLGAAPDDDDYTGGAGTCAATTQTAKLANGAGGAPANTTFTLDTSDTNTTFGQVIATKPAGAFSTGNLVFIGNISDTTEPGIYTTTLSFIATGTY